MSASVKINNFDELMVMARTVWGEARGEPFFGQVAVAHVICNRVMADLGKDGKPDWWGEGIAGVCLRPFQFSCWNEKDPNRPKMEKLTLDNLGLRKALAASMLALAEPKNDPTGGATHYHNKFVYPHPKWAWGRIPTAEIGKHRFFAGIE